ncbi:DUF5004 domain-containing protein [Flavivirga spongiicola]|uniref:DUF5004 domain-containing protein n=1 Tax=Flavivirga spongiicola TaxID=421621 RepID=A0ABU7XUX7_9FLAO|nr:DUF5004 domain-containing protein [Flavivirga sp. MEBiC05379]MDO5979586.1 DUF5004 domain-containing protein [Flavivirga sp. MEBiC05379]
MKNPNALLSSLLAVALLTISCSNDDNNCTEDLTGALSDKETSFAHKWVLSAIVSEKEIDLTDDNEDNPSTNIFDQYSDCEKDAFYDFKNDRSYQFSQGLNASNCNNKQTSSGTWKLTENSLALVSFCNLRIINIEFNTDTTSFSVDDNFIFTDVNDNRINSKTKITYTKVAI